MRGRDRRNGEHRRKQTGSTALKASARRLIGNSAGSTTVLVDSFIGGGYNNVITSGDAFVGAGLENSSEGPVSFVGAGDFNATFGPGSVVGAGFLNAAGGEGSFVGAGGAAYYNAYVGSATIFGNIATGEDSFVGAGDLNLVSGRGSFIGAGGSTYAQTTYAQTRATTAGNQIAGNDSFIGAGDYNNVSGPYSSIAGGWQNNASAPYTAIAGGYKNVTSGIQSAVGGGYGNVASGRNAIIPGGAYNIAGGLDSLAAGNTSHATYDGTFVWSDYSATTGVTSTASNQFLARAAGGFFLYSSANLKSGVKLAPGSGSWSSLSDRAAKTEIETVDDARILAKVASLPVSEWSYTEQGTGVRHLGPMAQDFRAAFGLGEDDKHISAVDEEGVALAAIKALQTEVAEKDQKLNNLEARIEALEKAKGI
jgi:hypothetical protein